MMKLSELIKRIETRELRNFTDVEISGISADSRLVERNNLFVAVPGSRADGHQYVETALAGGAVACISESPIDTDRVPNVVVEDSARALALLAAAWFGDPAEALINCGVTGTNGKTSTAHLLRAVVETAGWGKMGIIGTIGHGVGRQLETASHTTPDPVTLHRLLRDMRDAGCRGVVMEVSSHAVRQHRTVGIDFNVGILTNVTRDHLDYHSTIEDYIAAKRQFCESVAGPPFQRRIGSLVYSSDDPVAGVIGPELRGKTIAVGRRQDADVQISDVDSNLQGTRFKLRFPDDRPIEIRLKLLGRFSVWNAALAAAAAFELGVAAGDIKAGLESLSRVPGRFETIGGGEEPLIIVDYCHTPDAVEMTMKFCRDLEPSRITAVFGCGGDRDRGKRPLMGRIIQDYADVCYVTEDNPRHEPLDQIFEDILRGMNRTSAHLHVLPDRSEAIERAVAQSAAGDIVVLIGKGHETYQQVGSEKRYFSDREEAEKALERRRRR
jgi:UDP-N-acetylmuramoyl-L-alanyl-D-glutamate--2,6-diaminopimelate ligase